MSISPAIRKQQAYLLFFPAAAIYAALAVPLSVYAITTGSTWPPGLQGMSHAHEMLFGFALALVAGYTLGPTPQRPLLVLFTLWLLARLVYINVPTGLIAELLNAAFALGLAAYIVPKFRVAKKWRNRILSPLLMCLCLAPVIYAYTLYKEDYLVGRTLLIQAVLLFALLMAFVGGRIIVAGSNGKLERHRLKLTNRVQPKLEATFILLLLIAVLLLFTTATHLLAGISVQVAGMVLFTRLLRWRLWRCKNKLDLISFAMGYAWLALGLICLGTSILFEQHITAAIHIITVGALGSLSTGVIARLHFQQRRKQTPVFITVSTVALIAIATLSRIAANVWYDSFTLLLWVAASCWSLAYLILAITLLSNYLRREINDV